jgi:hypothetical protein
MNGLVFFASEQEAVIWNEKMISAPGMRILCRSPAKIPNSDWSFFYNLNDKHFEIVTLPEAKFGDSSLCSCISNRVHNLMTLSMSEYISLPQRKMDVSLVTIHNECDRALKLARLRVLISREFMGESKCYIIFVLDNTFKTGIDALHLLSPEMNLNPI